MKMAAAQGTKPTIRNFSPELRVVVHDVDEDRLHPACDGGRLQMPKNEGESESQNWENPTARIKRIQVEAECRKMEFARLLEEHAQVIRTLKQMEEKEMPHLISNSIANGMTAVFSSMNFDDESPSNKLSRLSGYCGGVDS